MRTRIKMPTYDKVPSTESLFLRLVIFYITVRALKVLSIDVETSMSMVLRPNMNFCKLVTGNE